MLILSKKTSYQNFFQKNVVGIKKCSNFAPQFQIETCSCSVADFSEQRAQCQTCLSIAESRRKAAKFGTNFAEIAQLVEHDLAKVGVASSSLVFRSKFFERIKAAKFS